MAAGPDTRNPRAFPVLEEGQLTRVSRLAHRRAVSQGEILFQPGVEDVHFFVLVSCAMEIVRLDGGREIPVAYHRPGEFTGEVGAMLGGRQSLVRGRVTEPGEVLELDGPALRRLVQTDADIGEVLLRAFLLRRAELIAHSAGDALLIGSRHSAGTLRVREFLTRTGTPFAYLDVERDADMEQLLERFHVAASDVPVVVCRGERVLKNPSNAEIAECFGLNRALDQEVVRDLLVIGAGPTGLAAAVYGASEGLDVLVLEGNVPGGQAGTSSRIENYLGFPLGISGAELTNRALGQVDKFGAEVVVACSAARLLCGDRVHTVQLDSGALVRARSVIIASGVQYRRLACAIADRLENRGVYYSATYVEAQLCLGEEVAVVGGANSAGQAAVYLASRARHVHLLVRGPGLAATMSRYLVQRIEESPNITLHAWTEIESMEEAADGSLARVTWRCSKTDKAETHELSHVFLMTGATPNTEWLTGCVALDEKGFVKTGSALTGADVSAYGGLRAPHLFETSVPRIFAVGDVRSGSVKRVASAVGEGSICVSFVHEVLQE